MSSPQFLSLEGIDKTGKTIISDILKTDHPDLLYVSDPPTICPWDNLFENGTRLQIPGISESFNFLAARLHCYKEKIKPALESGTPVVADRFSDSWIAYQSVFQEDDFEGHINPYNFYKRIRDLSEKGGISAKPDLTILITIGRGELEKRLRNTENPTEFEESVDKLWRVQEQYRKLLKEESDRMCEVHDGGGGVTALYDKIYRILERSGFLRQYAPSFA